MADYEKGFVLYLQYYEDTEDLTDEEMGKLMRSLFIYAKTGEVPEMDSGIKVAFKFIKNQMDRDNAKYEEVKRQRSEAGKLGGAVKGNTNASKTNENKQKQAKQANARSVKQNKLKEKDKEKDKVIDITPEGGLRGDLTSYSDKLQAKVSEWLSYKKERKQEYKPTGFIALMNKIDASVKKYGEKKIIELIDYSIVNQYQGIIWDRLEQQRAPNKDATYLSRDYKDGEQRAIIGDVLGDG